MRLISDSAALIDLSDLKATASEEERRNKQLSRSVAALAIMAMTEASAEEAAKSITDGYDDLGLDAIYFESAENTLYVACRNGAVTERRRSTLVIATSSSLGLES
jgi:hypothetical protein